MARSYKYIGGNGNVHVLHRWGSFRQGEWGVSPSRHRGAEDGLNIIFTFGDVEQRAAIREIQEILAEERFLRRVGDDLWIVDSAAVFERFNKEGNLNEVAKWLKGVVHVKPRFTRKERAKQFEIGQSYGTQIDVTVVFTIYREDYERNAMQKIFLSHKGADKPQVKRIKSSLDLLGFNTWLDEDDMPAGTELHRGIHKGFEDSCAAVFFITHNFRDESYLRDEINNARDQKIKKAGRFAIITLVFQDADGKEGVVPELLKPYVYRKPVNDLEAVQEIIRGLPLKLGAPAWREGL